MPEKYSDISTWSDDELVKLALIDDDDKDFPEEYRKDLGKHKKLAREELERRGAKVSKLDDLPPELANILGGNIGGGRKATPKRIYVSNEEFDKLVGRGAGQASSKQES